MPSVPANAAHSTATTMVHSRVTSSMPRVWGAKTNSSRDTRAQGRNNAPSSVTPLHPTSRVLVRASGVDATVALRAIATSYFGSGNTSRVQRPTSPSRTDAVPYFGKSYGMTLKSWNRGDTFATGVFALEGSW
jgi:hypothetical protein